MMVKPKHWLGDDSLRLYSVDAQGGVVIECEGISPKSFEGKNVTVYLDHEEAIRLMKDIRTIAIEARR